jgi:hypothetical protein
MAQTFDIRFARSIGLAAMFEAPSNRFRWKGAGRLSIDAEGVSFASKRSLLTPFHRTCRYAAGDLTEVYREGDELRLEFGTVDKREVLPIWASGSEEAAAIVKLRPTRRTVELEDNTLPRRRYRLDPWFVVPLLALVIAVVVLLALRRGYAARVPSGSQATEVSEVRAGKSPKILAAPAAKVHEATPDQSATTEHYPYSATDESSDSLAFPSVLPAEAELEASASSPTTLATSSGTPSSSAASAHYLAVTPSRSVIRDGIAAILTEQPEYRMARFQLEQFTREMNSLRADYLYMRDGSSYLKPHDLEARWWQVTERIARSHQPPYASLDALRDAELAVSRAWRHHLAALSSQDEEVARAFLELAEQLSARVVLYVE